MPRRPQPWLAALCAVVGAGCEGYGTFGDPFPIGVDMTSGPVVARLRDDGATEVRTAVIDVLSPITVLDAPDGDIRRRGTTLTLLGTGDVPRARLDVTVTELHPCPQSPCQVGPGDAPVAIDAIVGADALAAGAARFDFAASRMFLFPDVAGGDGARGDVCDAVLARPYFGGGTLSIGGAEVEFTGRRLAVSACLAFDPETDPDEASDAGADVLLVVSTGIGMTLLSESAYARWQAATGDTTTPTQAGSVWLPSGPVEGVLATVDRMALVGRDNTARGPCRIVHAHHLLSARSCGAGDDCPCDDEDASFCSVPGLIELTPPAPIDVLVIPDTHPLLQALRAELRPEVAEVDGILGTGALRATSLDLDTPHSRALLRCESGDGCVVRPEMSTAGDRAAVARCLALDVVDGGVPDAVPADAAP